MDEPNERLSLNMRRKAPAYMHFLGNGLWTQIKTKGGRFVVKPLDTANPVIATARIVPIIHRLIKEGQLDRDARVCRFYLPGRCPKCGRAMPGVK